jgi:hypothetical protein
MKTLQDSAGLFFATAVSILSVISVLGIWDFFSQDVINKSFETIGLLALVAIVIIVAGHFVGNHADSTVPSAPVMPNPIFKSIRYATLTLLIICVSALALLGVLAIWDVIPDKDVLYKSLSSVAILAFGAFVIVLTCLEREDSPLLKGGGDNGGGRSWSIGGVIGLLIVIYIIFSFSRLFLRF